MGASQSCYSWSRLPKEHCHLHEPDNASDIEPLVPSTSSLQSAHTSAANECSRIKENQATNKPNITIKGHIHCVPCQKWHRYALRTGCLGFNPSTLGRDVMLPTFNEAFAIMETHGTGADPRKMMRRFEGGRRILHQPPTGFWARAVLSVWHCQIQRGVEPPGQVPIQMVSFSRHSGHAPSHLQSRLLCREKPPNLQARGN
ncbi:hypothetical protein QBC35DRAFT_508284 [Podospora australis]|uniref:Uncharacterized protein n=1 Tax=Podospora australis TaxID=1536484 RepID=A0AAN6WL64_9PEZI|nr:hypothetical protein QBC35DRAFT_508284 [Podospora australis]